MKRLINYCLITLLILSISASLFAQSPDVFSKRRSDVIREMESGSMMIVKCPDNFDDILHTAQGGNFYYLTGINEPGSALILKKSGRRNIQLFIRDNNPAMADWEAQTTGHEAAQEKLGFRSVMDLASFQEQFAHSLADKISKVYMNHQRTVGAGTPLSPDEMIFKSARDRGSEFEVVPASSILGPMRRIKSEVELEILQKAVDLSVEGHKEMMRSSRPGMYEFQLQAIGEYVFRFNGAQAPGYESIVGSGINGCILHWSENSRKMEDGDMVVIDMGGQYENYTADITRSFPVNGKFTKRQREIYEIVLEANMEAIKMMKPGVASRDISNKVREVTIAGLKRLGMIKTDREMMKYLYHGVSHNIGLYVHDIGGLGRLEPGMVITIEPGLYVKDENFGVRIEDDVLITENGHRVLSAEVPKHPDEIEKLMKEKGMDISRYSRKK